MELVLGGLFGGSHSGFDELGVELAVHNSEYYKVQESDYEQGAAQTYRSHN